MKQFFTRTLCVLLAAALVAGLCPMVHAEDSWYTVTFRILEGQADSITLTDNSGVRYEAENNAVRVPAGSYFLSCEGENGRTEGTLQIERTQTVDLRLPVGNWFGEIRLLQPDQTAYPTENGDYLLPDTTGPSDVYLWAEQGQVPDANTTRLYACYEGIDGSDQSGAPRSWASGEAALPQLVGKGMEGRNLTLEARCPQADGFTLIQSQTLSILRTPTLTSLEVVSGGEQLLTRFDPTCYSYELNASQDTVELRATAPEGYTVEGAGQFPLKNGENRFSVTVENGRKTVYNLAITRTGAANVTILAPEGCTLRVFNAAGEEILPVGGAYVLTSGAAYTYETSRNGCSASAAFVAEDGLRLSAAAPLDEPAVADFALLNASSASTRTAYPCDTPFDPSKRSYTLTVPDASVAAYLQATPQNGYTLTARYNAQSTDPATHGKQTARAATAPVSATGRTIYLTSCLARSGFGQTVTLRAEKQSGTVTYRQDYTLHLRRSLHLASLDCLEAPLSKADGSPAAFDRNTTDYTLFLPEDVTALSLSAAFVNELADTPACGGYFSAVDGVKYDSLQDISVPIGGDRVTITLGHADETAVSSAYVLHLVRLPEVSVTFRVTQADASVYVTDSLTQRRVLPQQDGSFRLATGRAYCYQATCAGYVGVQNAKYIAPSQDEAITISLQKAPGSQLPQLPAQWPSARLDANNNAVTAAPIPTTSEDAALRWAVKLGEGYDSNACGSPILVDGSLYCYAGKTLYRLDALTGEILATAPMSAASSFAINTPTYYEGMIFIGQSNGTIQAFRADTLQSLWLYHDPLGGQPNCPITCRNGYLYTGFWRGEGLDGCYVCLPVTDEDPTRQDEEKLASWRHVQEGGFYWAGAYVDENFLLVGADDGQEGYETGHGQLLSLDTHTGLPLDALTLPGVGDVRCSIVRDGDYFYFTSKGGDFYQVQVEPNGHFKPNSLRSLPLGGMSTSTPTVYQGRAYVGVSGASQFEGYNGHAIAVIDLTGWGLAYTVPTRGYPQSSGVLTTAYDGAVYVYFLENSTKGTLRVLRDRPGQTEPDYTSRETYLQAGQTLTVSAAYDLFTPVGDHAQYTVCSPIVGDTGTLYFKNDSGWLMAVGSRIDALEVTTQPNKLSYAVGQTFDPSGMVITAHCANGTSMDVTRACLWQTEPLQNTDTELQIRFPHQLYQNCDGQSGVACTALIAVVSLQISGDHTHAYTQTVVAPTCLEAGYTLHVCACGDQFSDHYTEPLGHRWDNGVVLTPAGQFEDGLLRVTCTHCGETENRTIPATLVCPGSASCPARHFTDLPSGWAHAGIDFSFSRGLLNGMSQTTFGPNATMQRAMLVTVLWRMEESPKPVGANPFSDVDSDRYFYQPVVWAAENGIVQGKGHGEFAPSEDVSRQQIATILYRYVQFKQEPATQRSDLSAFPDQNKVAAYAYDALSWAVAEGLISGVKTGNQIILDPKAPATRAQVATILMRFVRNR